jgi:hypothetical protein
MSIRYLILTVALMASSVAFANLSHAQTAKGTDKMGGAGAAQLNPQPEPPGSTKRMGGGGGGKGAAGVTTVKSGKSNSSDRMGGGGGGKGAGQLNPQPEPPGRR